MDTGSESWSNTHDLALVFIALAYGTDRILADEELAAIVAAVQKWQPDWAEDKAQELVMEALAVFLDGPADEAVTRAIKRLKTALDRASRVRALEDVVRIAEADGIVLGSERSLISVLARAWDIRDLPEPAEDETEQSWGILHDVGLLYVAVAHGGDSDLSDAEIQAMISRLIQWQPDLEEAGARKVLREALKYYSTQPGSDDFSESVRSIRDTFPTPQRIAVLDDLMFIAESDGSVTAHEEQIIKALSDAWEIGVKMPTQS